MSDGCSVITRKDGGAVIVKGSGSGEVSVENGGGYAKPGTYTDAVSGNTFTITSSTISGTIGSSGIAVVYDAEPEGPSASVTPVQQTTIQMSSHLRSIARMQKMLSIQLMTVHL